MEREALLSFKKSLTNPSGRLSSWVGPYCCKWVGIGCDNTTGYVFNIDLKNPFPILQEREFCNKSFLGGKISSSLLNFKHLSYLDLSMNNFNGINIPKFLGSIKTLQYLNLSCSFFVGIIPIGLGDLTNLRRLDLAGNNISGKIPSSFSNLCNLQMFSLTDNKIGGEINEFVNGLSQCSNYSNLESLLLSGNKLLGGNIPYSLGEVLKKLKNINLGSCSFWGLLPNSIGDMSSLEEVNLRNNQIRGTILESIDKLLKLVLLDLSWNLWRGLLTEAHFQNLTLLKVLNLSMEFSTKWALALDVKHNWVPPFKLTFVQLDNVQVGPKFPSWLQTQNELNYLSLDNVGISDTMPLGFWNSCSTIDHLHLSNNRLHGQVPYTRSHHPIHYIDLSSNNLEGLLPIFLKKLCIIYLLKNMFSGPIPEKIGELLPRLVILDLSSNSFTNRIPRSIGMLQNLSVLILKNNYLSGQLPPQWEDLKLLRVLDVVDNSIFGNFLRSMQYLSSLGVLSLSQNQLEGELPSFFRNYTKLINLDLGGNKFCGNVLALIGESLSSLRRLCFKSNFFDGDIPQQLCLLSGLHVLDLANNDFSREIPQCLGNLSKARSSYGRNSFEQIMVVFKGREYVYNFNLDLVYSLDLSSNKISGEIPDNITRLVKLVSMNLSMNHLTGKIPQKIGNLGMLESLDLSRNKLFGPIPDSLSSLNFLSYLNLSSNNLSRKIPSRNQLQTLRPAIKVTAYFVDLLFQQSAQEMKSIQKQHQMGAMMTRELSHNFSMLAWQWVLFLDFGEFAAH